MAKHKKDPEQVLRGLYAPYPQPQPPAYPAPKPPVQTMRVVNAAVLQNHDAAVAEVGYQAENGEYYRGSGASKRERGDKPDAVTGELLAAARAFEEMSDRLFRAARSRVRAQDAERHQKETRKTLDQWKAEKKAQESTAFAWPPDEARGFVSAGHAEEAVGSVIHRKIENYCKTAPAETEKPAEAVLVVELDGGGSIVVERNTVSYRNSGKQDILRWDRKH